MALNIRRGLQNYLVIRKLWSSSNSFNNICRTLHIHSMGISSRAAVRLGTNNHSFSSSLVQHKKISSSCELLNRSKVVSPEETNVPTKATAKRTLFQTLLDALPFGGKLKSRTKAELVITATKLYVCCAEYSDFKLFSDRFNLEDTFYSWCNVLQLHTWMLMMRLKNHNLPMQKEFDFLVYEMNKSMWSDIEKRASKFAVGSLKKESLVAIGESYKALVLSYDEGYFTDDQTLAGAIWRSLLVRQESVEPDDLTLLLDYIHKNLSHLQSIPDEQLLDGFVTFLPLYSDKPHIEKDERVHKLVSSLYNI